MVTWKTVFIHLLAGAVACLWKKREYIGPILDDRLKEKILKPWKGALSSHSVCLSVCERATGHTFWPRNAIFGLSDP